MSRIVCLFLLLLPPAALAAGACADDPRIFTSPETLGATLADGEWIRMTPETFLLLQPAVRKSLGSRIAICPAIPLNDRGVPRMRLKLPFPVIWEALERAVNLGDWEEVDFIARSVQAQPMPAEALFSLLSLPVWSEANMRKLAKALNIAPHVQRWRFFVLDVYQALGGAAANPARIGFSPDYGELAAARSKAQALKKDGLFLPYSGAFANEAKASLRNVGVEMIEANKFFQ